MRSVWLIRLLCVVVLTHGLSTFALANKFTTRVALQGCNGYFAASGNARYIQYRDVPNVKDYEELVIDVKNVPLTPGTVLVVYVGEESLGHLKLNSRREGKFTLKSDPRTFVPKLTYGSSVTLKKLDGSLVIW